MKDSRLSQIAVGSFGIVGIGILFVLVFLFGGGRSPFADTYDISIHFPAGVTGGVQIGQTVTLNGKRIGETSDLQFWNPAHLEEGIKLVVTVDEEFAVPATSEMVVAASIMGLGRPWISLVVKDPKDPGTLARDGRAVLQGRMVQLLDQVLPPKMQRTLEEATRNIGGLAEELTPVAKNLTRLLDERELDEVDSDKEKANIDAVVQRIDLLMRNLNNLLGDTQTRENFQATLANLRKASESGVTLVDNLAHLSEDVRPVVKNLEEFSGKLGATIDTLQGLLAQINKFASRINEGKGTLSLMIDDSRLYEELVLTVQRMKATMDEMREVLDKINRGEKIRIQPW